MSDPSTPNPSEFPGDHPVAGAFVELLDLLAADAPATDFDAVVEHAADGSLARRAGRADGGCLRDAELLTPIRGSPIPQISTRRWPRRDWWPSSACRCG